MQRFGSLEVGQKFYLPDKNGKVDLKASLRLQKLCPVNFSDGVNTIKTKVMKSVIENGNSFNATVLGGQEGKLNGYYAFVDNDKLVLLDMEGSI
ncbi:MAG: hypothetical protein WD898_00575 [Candidatus Paceibacterota bacterium]